MNTTLSNVALLHQSIQILYHFDVCLLMNTFLLDLYTEIITNI